MKNIRNQKKFLLGLLFLFVLLVQGCGKGFNLPKKNLEIICANGKTVAVKVEIAEKPEERNYGFMNRKKIPDGTGMLFVFEYDQILSFWMKNTIVPLSIAYISKDGTIKDIQDMQPLTLSSHVSNGYVRYALEVPQGWFSKNGISIGDKLADYPFN